MIQWNKETLEEPNTISQLLPMAQAEWGKRRKLYERIVRKTSDSEMVSEDDSKIKIGFEYYINSMVTGYFAGKPPVYDVEKGYDEETNNFIKKIFKKVFNTDEKKQKELKSLIEYITKYNDDATEFFELAWDYFGMCACYEILYENNENQIVYAKQSALNTIAIWDFSTPMTQIGSLRCWNEIDASGNTVEIVELTTLKGKFYYNRKPEKKEYEELQERRSTQNWDMLPCIATENEMCISCFELAIPLICAYERVVQNSRNVFKYNDEAKLKVVGYDVEDDLPLMIPATDKEGKVVLDEKGNPKMVLNPGRVAYDENIIKAKVFYTDKDGDVAWIEKNINDTSLQNHKKTLVDLITMITGVPNITDLGFTTAENASALDRKFFTLEQMVTSADKKFKKSINRRWETIISKINKTKSTQYDFRNVKTDLQRNLPTDKGSETDRALKLRGLLSDASIIDMLPDDLDSNSELEKIDKQNEENMQKNLENMQKIGQDSNEKVGNANENMDISQSTDAENENNVSKDEQTNSKQTSRNF